MTQILLVCTGNTCRSPLAEVLLRSRLAAHPVLASITAGSAGTAAWGGSPASEGSLRVARERGLDLSPHRARPLTAGLIEGADLILTMSRMHAADVVDLGGGTKVHTLAEYAQADDFPPDVADPYGGDITAYRDTAEMIDALLSRVVERLARDGA